jgi:uncharacterized protein (TIGR02246 family)
MTDAQRREIEATIRQVFEEGCAAWNRGDLDGYLSSYWDSEKTLWVSGGAMKRGREAIAAAYKARFSTPSQMGSLTLTDLEIDVLTAADAIVFGRWQVEAEGGSANGFFTVQLKKMENAWVYVADHSSTRV